MAIQAFRLGSVGQDSITNVKVMAAHPLSTDYYMTFEYPIGTDFVVTAGYTLYMTKIIFYPDGAGVGPIIGYGDNGVASGAAAPTNWVQITQAIPGLATGQEYDIFVPIPAGKYPCMKNFAGVTRATIYGVEIAN